MSLIGTFHSFLSTRERRGGPPKFGRRREGATALLAAAACIASGPSLAFASGPTFQNTYVPVPNTAESVACITRTADGGYIFVGNKSPASSPPLIGVAKLDQSGVQKWYREYTIPSGIPNQGLQADCIRQVSDGSYIISGRFRPLPGTSNGLYLLRLNADGSVRTARSYAGLFPGDLGTTAVRESITSSLIFLGGVQRKFAVVANTPARQGLLIETDENLIQRRTGVFSDNRFGANTWMDFDDVHVNADATYTILGHVGNSDFTTREVFLLRTSPTFTTPNVFEDAWVRTYMTPIPGSGINNGYFGGGLIPIPDDSATPQREDGWAFAGRYTIAGVPTGSFVVRTDNNGLLPAGFWANKYTAIKNGAHLRRDDLGSLVLAGQNSAMNQAAILHLSAIGGVPSSPLAAPYPATPPLTVFGGPGNDSVRSIEQAADGGYIAAGVFNAIDYYVVKFDNALTNAPMPPCFTTENVTRTVNSVAFTQNFTSVAAPPDASLIVAASAPALTRTELCPNPGGCVNPVRNLTLWLPFDEGAGETNALNLADPTGTRDGTHADTSIAGATGKCGVAAQYGATSNSTVVPHYPEIDFSGTSITLSASVNLASVPPAGQEWPIMQKLVRLGATANERGYRLSIRRDSTGTGGSVLLRIGAGGTPLVMPPVGLILPSPVAFTQLTVTISRQRVIVGTTPFQRITARFYLNCNLVANLVQDAPTDSTSTPIATGSAANLLIGGNAVILNRFLGKIDEPAIYSRELDPADVANLCNCMCKIGCNFLPPAKSFPALPGAVSVNMPADAFDLSSYLIGFNDKLTANVLQIGGGITSSGITAAVPPSVALGIPTWNAPILPSPSATRVAMNTGTTAGFEVFIRSDPTSGIYPPEAASCVARVYNPVWWFFEPSPRPILAGTGQLVGSFFTVTNTSSDARTLNYSISAARSGGQPVDLNDLDAGVLSLNAQAPGVPITGVIQLGAGQSQQIPFDVLFSDGDPLGGYSLVVKADENADGIEEVLNSVSVRNDISAPRCVADTDDGSGTGTPDGGVTIDDLLFYLSIFENGDIRADVDDGSATGTLDGGVTIDDLLYFLFRFENGC